MKFNIIVCGKFHYENFVKYYNNDCNFNKIYFSHKIKSFSNVSGDKKINIFIKEYLVGGYIKLFGRSLLLSTIIKVSHYFWEAVANFYFEPADVNLFMLHGNCESLIKKVKRNNGIVVLEAVNAHPKSLARIVNFEMNRLGISGSKSVIKEKNMINEIAMADYIICPSRSVADSFVDNGFPEDRIRVIPYGVGGREGRHEEKNDNPRYGRLDGQRRNLLCVGQISFRKGQVRIFEALGFAGRLGEFEITLAGSIDSDYKCIINSYDYCHVPHIPHSEIFTFMGKYELLILLSVEDGFAMVVTEAVEAGIPVVVSKNAGVSELIENYGGGIVVDPYNDREIVDAIDRCLRGDFPVAQEFPSWEIFAGDLKNTLTVIADSNKSM